MDRVGVCRRVETQMKTLIKRTVMWAYCHDLITSRTVEKMFYRFGLKGH